jgi:hypothetical protein
MLRSGYAFRLKSIKKKILEWLNDKSGFKLHLSSEWNVESSVKNLKFPEVMIEVTQIASFLHEINLEAQKTIIKQDTTLR